MFNLTLCKTVGSLRAAIVSALVQYLYCAADGKDDVELVEYPATAAGIVESFMARFPTYDSELEALWRVEVQ